MVFHERRFCYAFFHEKSQEYVPKFCSVGTKKALHTFPRRVTTVVYPYDQTKK
jgi:hypothetical protein